MAKFRWSLVWNWVGLLTLAGILIAFQLWMFFRSSYPSHGEALPVQAVTEQRLSQLQAAVSRLEMEKPRDSQPQPKAGPESASGRDLRQHEELLDEIRTEIKVTQDQLRESNEAIQSAKETTRKVQDEESAFLAIFAIIAAVIAGQGYLEIRGWKAEVEEVRPIILSIKETHESLETELPKFLDSAKGILTVEDFEQQHIALMDQIDHFTFLNTPMRFRQLRPEAAEAEKYIEGVRIAASAHLARGATWKAISRLDEFFSLSERFPKSVTPKNKASAYSYRALAIHQQLVALLAEESWVREQKDGEFREKRDQAFSYLKQARQCHSEPTYPDFVEALLHSLRFMPNNTINGVSPEEAFLLGQRNAVKLYRGLIQTTTGRKRRASFVNLACCLKRIADTTGASTQYSELENELQSFPSDKQLWEQTASTPEGRIVLTALWQRLMSDDQLFAKADKIDAQLYKAFWIRLLDQKVFLHKWRDNLAELQLRNNGMKSWKITLL